MSAELTLESMRPWVGERFAVAPTQGEPFEAVLSECEPTPYGDPARPAAERTPFSLLFHAPVGALVPQQICVFRHEGAGELALFVVPLGPDERGMRYEAVIA